MLCKLRIDRICNCFVLSNVDGIELNGGTNLTMFFTTNTVDIRLFFLTVPDGSLKHGRIILLNQRMINFGEEVFMPQKIRKIV